MAARNGASRARQGLIDEEDMPVPDSIRPRDMNRDRLGAWARGNLTTQGYCLSDDERRRLAFGLRFSTATCLLLVVTALVLRSPPMIFALSGVGLVAGASARHPFDLVWNHMVRHLAAGPPLPPNPTRRRHAFKVATVWLLAVGTLLAAGASTIALILGGLLVAACATVTVTNFCVPSELLALWARRTANTAARVAR
jgi:Domain of unknown function (DUF4395)